MNKSEKWIRLDGLCLDVSIGIHDFEMVSPQPYRIDVGLKLAEDYETKSDQIAETVNYDALRDRVKSHLASKHFNLQETVVQDIIKICFELDERVICADVKTSKSKVYPDCEGVGLHYTVCRAGRGSNEARTI